MIDKPMWFLLNFKFTLCVRKRVSVHVCAQTQARLVYWIEGRERKGKGRERERRGGRGGEGKGGNPRQDILKQDPSLRSLTTRVVSYSYGNV